MALTIEQADVETLSPHPNNPRRGDVATIVDSLKANGQFRPLVVSEDGVVLAGNHTLQAAKQLGWTEIDVVRLPVTGDSEEAVRVMLADNRASDLGSYDDNDLLMLLESLNDLEGTGYLPDDLDDLQHLTGLRDVTAGSGESHYSGAGLAADGVIPDKGLQALQDDYAAKSVRSVILAYDLGDFDEVTKLMSAARQLLDVDSNSEAVLLILREHCGDH